MSSNNKRNALGRGLSALLENETTDITSRTSSRENVPLAGSVSQIPVAHIETNPFQPRTHFEEQALQELSDSIKEHGIIQPVTVRKMGYDKYQLISGERRFRASQLAGLEQIPAYVRVANDQSMLEMALVENIQRENLDAIEVAISYKRLIDECSLTQEALGKKVSKDCSTVTNYLRLLKLPAPVQNAIRDRKLSMGHARALVNIEDPERMLAIFNAVIENELSVRATEELVRGTRPIPGKEEKPETGKKSGNDISLQHKKIIEDLSSAFNSKVDLKVSESGKGKLTISFKNQESLERILSILDN